MSLIVSQIKYRKTKAVNFRTDQWNVNKLDDIVNKYNKTSHSKIKMNPVDVNSSTSMGFNKKNNKEDRKLKVDDHVRISEYKNVFANVYVPNWSEDWIDHEKNPKFLNKSIYFWLAFKSYCFHAYV